MLQADWFRNLGPNDPFLSGKQSLDFSLQLAKGLDNFSVWKSDFTPSPPTPNLVAANESVANESTAGAPVAMQQDVKNEAYVSPVFTGDEEVDASLPQALRRRLTKEPGFELAIATTVILVAVLFGPASVVPAQELIARGTTDRRSLRRNLHQRVVRLFVQ